MRSTRLPDILQTRLLVGYLGERAQHGWWPTAFYETSSRLFLEPVFSKTAQLAQYHGVLEAARRIHDEHLSVGSYHLFRLPEEVEQDLQNLLQRSQAVAFALKQMHSMEGALNHLGDLAGDVSTAGSGPIVVGHIRELASPEIVKAMAAAYLSAFRNSTHIYPYLLSRA